MIHAQFCVTTKEQPFTIISLFIVIIIISFHVRYFSYLVEQTFTKYSQLVKPGVKQAAMYLNISHTFLCFIDIKLIFTVIKIFTHNFNFKLSFYGAQHNSLTLRSCNWLLTRKDHTTCYRLHFCCCAVKELEKR